MKEQSHKDEMSAAIRGDFERLRGRGVATELASRPQPVVVEPTVSAVEDAEPIAPEEPETMPPQAREGWLGRLLGRS